MEWGGDIWSIWFVEMWTIPKVNPIFPFWTLPIWYSKALCPPLKLDLSVYPASGTVPLLRKANVVCRRERTCSRCKPNLLHRPTRGRRQALAQPSRSDINQPLLTFLESKTNRPKITTNVTTSIFHSQLCLVTERGCLTLKTNFKLQIGILASGCLPRTRWGRCWTNWWAPKETVSHKISQPRGYPTFQDECSLQIKSLSNANFSGMTFNLLI